MAASLASSTTSQISQVSRAPLNVPAYTPAPFVADPTRLSPGPVAVPPSPMLDFFQVATPLQLQYPRLLSKVVHRPAFDHLFHERPDIFDKVITPYDPAAFNNFLVKHSLGEAYPDLVSFLVKGFPIGDMPPLVTTHILNNHASLTHHSALLDEYLADEKASGRIDGPFSLGEITRILRGPFQSSPLVVVVQPQAPGEPDKIRICRHLSKSKDSIMSVNSFIKTTHFPTRFDTAARVAELVSSFFPLSLPASLQL